MYHAHGHRVLHHRIGYKVVLLAYHVPLSIRTPVAKLKTNRSLATDHFYIGLYPHYDYLADTFVQCDVEVSIRQLNGNISC